MSLQGQLETAAAVIGTPRTLHIVHKAQCIASFNTAKSPGGLYINLMDGAALSPDYLSCDTQAGPIRAYLHVQDIPAEDQSGATGSGTLNQAGQEEYTFSMGVAYDSHYALAICDDSGAVIGEVGLQHVQRGVDGMSAVDNAIEIPAALRAAIANVMSATDAADAAATAAAGFAFQTLPSKFSDTLKQVDPADPAAHAVPADPADWKCAACGLTSNLWFNLGDGYIGCGRKNAMGTGGEQHALKHFEETGSKYPLVVKLGTITPDGKADVFCYDASENDMVVDTQLVQHLAHWGLDPAGMVKTERTMAELNLDLNQRVELASIQEEGKALAPLTGPGYVGMRNTGNSCYMNSLLQALFSVPEVQQRLAPGCDTAARVHTGLLHEAVASRAVTSQVYPALHKLAASLLSQREVTDECVAAVQAHAAAAAASPAVPEKELADARDEALAAVQAIAIVPANLRRVVAAQHVEFTQGTQQDVLEYLRHFIAQCEQAEKRGQLGVVAGLPEGVPQALSKLFTSQIETRLQCSASGGVQYSTTPENVLDLPVPMPEQLSTAPMKRARSDSGEGEEPAVPTVPFDVCLAAWAAEDTVENWQSPATGERGTATTRRRIAHMPRVLCVGMKRYTVNERWEPVKLDVLVPAPEHLSLEHLRGHGLQGCEVPLPEAVPAAQPEANPDIVAAVTGMGFTAEAAQRAALACGNSDAEAAVSWVLAHMDDPDLNEPLPDPASSSGASAGPAVSAEALAMLSSMGFAEPQAKRALQENGNNVEAATAWIFEHLDEMGPDGSLPGDGAGADAAAAPQAELEDGPGEYDLVACVSHIGKTTGGGHYVCHVRRPCGWVQINDNKVTTSLSPPLDRAYLYVYRRTDVPVAGVIGQPIGL